MKAKEAAASRGKTERPRILIVTPEITYLPEGMGNMSQRMNAKAGGLADVSSSLVSALFDLGADVHVALPNYRQLFNVDVGKLHENELLIYRSKLPNGRVHLAEDRIFYYQDQVYGSYDTENPRIALTFQREVINNIMPRVNPHLIHCNDWMTGLIPGMARRIGIPSLFTVHNIHTETTTLAQIEDHGIDAAAFWPHLFFERRPESYEETRTHNPVDLLASGIFASHFINTVSPSFLDEIAAGRHDFIPSVVRSQIINKCTAGCASGILNAPDPSFNPATDETLAQTYTAEDHREGKAVNKREFQRQTGLAIDPAAPLFFWPSRLDPVQKGCQLVTDILYELVSDYWHDNLQVAVVANGAHQEHFHHIVGRHGFHGRVAVRDFDEKLSRLGYAGSDFMLMPSSFEPCGLPQMISPIYGALPIVHDTGGLHDTITPLEVEKNTGNGFLFGVFDTAGLRWAIDEGMRFFRLPSPVREANTSRIMKHAAATFNHAETAKNYISIYERMVKRPLVNPVTS